MSNLHIRNSHFADYQCWNMRSLNMTGQAVCIQTNTNRNNHVSLSLNRTLNFTQRQQLCEELLCSLYPLDTELLAM